MMVPGTRRRDRARGPCWLRRARPGGVARAAGAPRGDAAARRRLPGPW